MSSVVNVEEDNLESASVFEATGSGSSAEIGTAKNPALYKYEENRVSSACLYFDNEKLESYKSVLSSQVRK